MNAHTGKWQLQRIILKYSETGGSSLGTRFNLCHLLPRWKARNPHVEVITQHSQFEHPEMTCHFRSGEACTVTLKNVSAKQLEDMMDLYRNSESPNLFLRHGGPRVWTERRSIQGLWQPSFELYANVLKWAHKRDMRKRRLYYSDYSLKLSKQAHEGHGRWGDESVSRRGFDREVLHAVFAQPFLKVAPKNGVSHSTSNGNPTDDDDSNDSGPKSNNLPEYPVETKDPLPIKALQAMKSHISDATTEKQRNAAIETGRNLKKRLRMKGFTVRRKQQEREWRKKNMKKAAAAEEEDSNNSCSKEDLDARNAEMHEMRRLRLQAQKSTRRIVEEKLAAQAMANGV